MAVVSSIVAGSLALGSAAASGAAALGASAGIASGIGAATSIGASLGAYGAIGYGLSEAWGGLTDMLSPDMPKAPEPEAAVSKGDEGIRRGEVKREARKREIGALYLTRGQRSDDSTLGGYTKSLGG